MLFLFLFSLFLKEADWRREVLSMSFYVFEGGRLGDKGGAVYVFLCFSLFFVSVFFCVFCVFYVFFCVFLCFLCFFLCFFGFFLCF